MYLKYGFWGWEMLTSSEKIREMRCKAVEIITDKYKDEPISYSVHVDKFKDLAKQIRDVLPGYYEMEIKNRYASSLQDLNYVVHSCKGPLTRELVNGELSALLGRMVYMIGFMETHSSFSGIDDRDVKAMHRNFRYVHSRYDRHTVDCVCEVLDYFKDIYVISERLQRAGLSNKNLKEVYDLEGVYGIGEEKECD